MSVTYFTTMQEVAEWIEMKMSDGDAEFVMASMADILRTASREPGADRRIASQALLNFFQNVANS